MCCRLSFPLHVCVSPNISACPFPAFQRQPLNVYNHKSTSFVFLCLVDVGASLKTTKHCQWFFWLDYRLSPSLFYPTGLAVSSWWEATMNTQMWKAARMSYTSTTSCGRLRSSTSWPSSWASLRLQCWEASKTWCVHWMSMSDLSVAASL